MRSLLKKIFALFGYELRRSSKQLEKDGVPLDITDPEFLELFKRCDAFSFTGIVPLFSLYNSVKYVAAKNIPGDLVECGVWKGGSAMLMALTLMKCGITDRKIYLYDTFEGMSEPTTADEDLKGNKAGQLLKEQDKHGEKNVWCYSTLEEVKKNMAGTGYPEGNIILVKGKVEDSIPGTIPSSISLLRLDTDWYESTYHELKHLYPILTEKGVLIIDDYGHWKGARKAVDQYISEHKLALMLNRIDYTVRIAIKD